MLSGDTSASVFSAASTTRVAPNIVCIFPARGGRADRRDPRITLDNLHGSKQLSLQGQPAQVIQS